MVKRYVGLTDDWHDEKLAQLVFENASTLLEIPGVYEAVSEFFNNDILEAWEMDHPEDSDEAQETTDGDEAND